MGLTGCPWWAKGLFGGLFCLMIVLILQYGNEGERSEERRWTPDGIHLTRVSGDAQHPFLQNYWYRYMQALVKQQNLSECYVCSVLPHHSEGPTLYGRFMNKAHAECVSAYSGTIDTNHTLRINATHSRDKSTCDPRFWAHFTVTKTTSPYPFTVLMNRDPLLCNHTMCFTQENGTIPLGSTGNCDQTWINGAGTKNGTYLVDGVAWLCGNKAYLILPPNWKGTCAPIFISDHSFVIRPEVAPRRRKRDNTAVQPHDSIWGTDVPPDQKLWNTGEKIALSMFPALGVGKLLLRTETLTYRLGLFMNASIIIDQQQNNQLDVTRQMAVQNRMALDLLTAAQGGVCVLINQTCCTYIPDNVHSSNMTDALQKLKNLQAVMARETQLQDLSWLNWFTSGSWWMTLMKICIPFLAFFILFFCCFLTVIPCIRMLISSALNSAFRAQEHMLLSLTQNMETEVEDDDSVEA